MLELALIGGGRMGETHLRALRHVPELTVRGLVEPDAARRQVLAQRYGIRGWARLEEALPEVQAVALALPPGLLASTAVEVLRAGRHLFIEKPVALNPEEAGELAAEAARHSELRVQVGFHLRHHPYFRQARCQAPRLVRSVFVNSSGLRPQPAWRASVETGGSVLTNLAVHHFDLWRAMTGLEVEEVQAIGHPLETVSVQARLTGGVVASGVFSHLGADRNELELYGERARVRAEDYRVDGLEHQTVGTLPGGLAQRVAGWARLARAFPERLLQGSAHDQAYRRQWQSFARQGPAATLEDGLRAAEIAWAAQESLTHGRPVRL